MLLPGMESILFYAVSEIRSSSFLSLLPKGPSHLQPENCFLGKLLLWGMKALARTWSCFLLGIPQLNRPESPVNLRVKCRKQLAPNLSKGAKQSRADGCPGQWEQEPGTCQMLHCPLSCALLPSMPAMRMAVHTTTFSFHRKPTARIPLNSFSSKYFDPWESLFPPYFGRKKMPKKENNDVFSS